MRLYICMCCGKPVDFLSGLSPNVCSECFNHDWASESSDLPVEANSPSLSMSGQDLAPSMMASIPAEAPSEVERMLDLDEPGVIECLEEELAAKKAISEALAKEIEEMQRTLSRANRRVQAK